MDTDVIHEVGRFYVVRDRSKRPSGRGAFSARFQGPIADVVISRVLGLFAREKAIARADALASQEA